MIKQKVIIFIINNLKLKLDHKNFFIVCKIIEPQAKLSQRV